MSIAGAIALLKTLWGMRFIIALCGAFILGCWVVGWWGRTQDLKRERDDLIATNQATMEALDAVKAEKARNETLLADRAARKSKEADRLGKLVQHILESKDEGACPSLPLLSDTISRLP